MTKAYVSVDIDSAQDPNLPAQRGNSVPKVLAGGLATVLLVVGVLGITHSKPSLDGSQVAPTALMATGSHTISSGSGCMTVYNGGALTVSPGFTGTVVAFRCNTGGRRLLGSSSNSNMCDIGAPSHCGYPSGSKSGADWHKWCSSDNSCVTSAGYSSSASPGVSISSGVTMTELVNNGGTDIKIAGASVTTVSNNGGSITTDGSTVTNVIVAGGSISGTVAGSMTKASVQGGSLKAQGADAIGSIHLAGGKADISANTIGPIQVDGGRMTAHSAKEISSIHVAGGNAAITAYTIGPIQVDGGDSIAITASKITSIVINGGDLVVTASKLTSIKMAGGTVIVNKATVGSVTTDGGDVTTATGAKISKLTNNGGSCFGPGCPAAAATALKAARLRRL